MASKIMRKLVVTMIDLIIFILVEVQVSPASVHPSPNSIPIFPTDHGQGPYYNCLSRQLEICEFSHSTGSFPHEVYEMNIIWSYQHCLTQHGDNHVDPIFVKAVHGQFEIECIKKEKTNCLLGLYKDHIKQH